MKYYIAQFLNERLLLKKNLQQMKVFNVFQESISKLYTLLAIIEPEHRQNDTNPWRTPNNVDVRINLQHPNKHQHKATMNSTGNKCAMYYKSGAITSRIIGKQLEPREPDTKDEYGDRIDDEFSCRDSKHDKKKAIQNVTKTIMCNVYLQRLFEYENELAKEIFKMSSDWKSSLLNLIETKWVFEVSGEKNCRPKTVKMKYVQTLAGKECYLLEVEHLFSENNFKQQDNITGSEQKEEEKILPREDIMTMFLLMYCISSIIVWNDTKIDNPIFLNLLEHLSKAMKDVNTEYTNEDLKQMLDGITVFHFPKMQDFFKKRVERIRKKNGQLQAVA
ncbi:hypothetical protein RFI_04739 [Reticulomyxa filosa]|uniref:Uncharacterized protein n=1 Tax=Reticulomyxa filosa TaxID=46433 RepID=X6P2G8_RETFI|nr:hypothetical protein RFI_04739 [Reticulomyxa filosa]|eukprot:ETO32386.1 hypothetical protein RFI_04739 [Reticulomyxa filosa]